MCIRDPNSRDEREKREQLLLRFPMPKGFSEYLTWKRSLNIYQPDEWLDRSAFNSFSATPGLSERIVALPFETQRALLESRNSFVRSCTLMAMLDLLEETQTDYREARQWRIYNRSAIPQHITRPTISSEFEPAFESFLRFQKNAHKSGNPEAHALDGVVVLLLVKKYGEKSVVEAMRAWRGNQMTKNVSDFKKVVERWEDVKHTSIDWALILLDVESDGMVNKI